MPAQIFGTPAVVTILNRAFNDSSPSNATFNNQVAAAGTTREANLAFALTFGAGFAGLTADAASTKLLGNLGLLPNADLQTGLKDYITSVGIANIGVVALQLGEILSGLENATGPQAIYAAPALAWNNEVTAAYNYSANPANTGPSGTGNAQPGSTFTLTGGTDTLAPDSAVAANKTTAGDDVIRAVAAGDLATVDFIDGGAGKDTLNAAAGLNGAVVAPVLKNIEVINVAFTAGDQLDLSASTGYTEVNAKGSTALGGVAGGDFSNIKLGTTVGVVDGDIGAVFGFASVSGAADAATLNVADAAAAAPVTIAGIEAVTVNSIAGSVAATVVNSIALTATEAESITVTGSQALTLALGANSPALSTIDASALTKALTLSVTTAAAATTAGLTIKGTATADSITVTGVNGGSKLTVDLGDGNDTLVIGDWAFHKITLGGGSDTVLLDAKAATAMHKNLDISTAAKLAASVIEITDFVSGTDVLNIDSTASTKTTLTGTQLTNIANSSSLLTAVQAVDALVANGGSAVFQYGADTYVWVDEGAAGLNAADVLVKLTGLSTVSGASVVIS